MIDIQILHDDELISLRAALDAEMRKRGIAFSVGQIGERLVIDYFCNTPGLPNLQDAPRGTKNVDALSRNGDRYSIKTICNAKKTGTIYPDTNNKDKQLFEYLLIVTLTKEWNLYSIYQLDWNLFVKKRLWDKRMSAWYLGVSHKLLKDATEVYRV